MRTERRPVLMAGRGLIGAETARLLRTGRQPVITLGRGGQDGKDSGRAGWLSADLGTDRGRELLHDAVLRLRPHSVVLSHGPSDVNWIDRHEEQARLAHVGAVTAVAGTAPVILVSTDNVFPGDRRTVRSGSTVRPGNAYGRVKALAERALLSAGDGMVLRMSLVYGWAPAGRRVNYGQRCLLAAELGERLEAPDDQAFTPLHVRDAARVLAALCLVPRLPGAVAHLAGPRELSRFDFARLAYTLAGADPGLVRRCSRSRSEWASRPRFSSLACDDFSAVAGLGEWGPLAPADGLRLMLREARP